MKIQAWFIGNGKTINVWKDHWIGEQPLCDYIDPKSAIWKDLNATLNSCIMNGHWAWPEQLVEITTRLGLDIYAVRDPNVNKEDECYWPYDNH
ncbi:hypothetical protein FRX31_005753, partial [Thalictrum thalictroides]